MTDDLREVVYRRALLLMYGNERPGYLDRYRMPSFDAVTQALAEAIAYGEQRAAHKKAEP